MRNRCYIDLHMIRNFVDLEKACGQQDKCKQITTKSMAVIEHTRIQIIFVVIFVFVLRERLSRPLSTLKSLNY